MEKDRESRALSKAGRKSGRGKHHLSDEERALWEHTTSNLRPLKQKKGRVHVGHERPTEQVKRGSTQALRPSSKRTAEHPPPKPLTPPAPPKSAPPLYQLDRRKARKISSGRIEIEGRIDLHGMRQSQAHTALRRFLLNAQAKGRRWVLVITGKGTAPRVNPEVGDYAGLRDDERGVLKRNVPRWLTEPELRAIVISFSPASARHGGEGALYVQLRKRRRVGSDE